MITNVSAKSLLPLVWHLQEEINYTLNEFEFYLTCNFSTIILDYGSFGYSIHFKTNHLKLKKVPEKMD